ncbi:MAG: hypothetical protein Ct9H300mP26_5130 [Acidimicrobiales bacterium]|nr:MAG: hypothetical protein Ct9H300mP26_5130 [Acidimicrobiales bacterium]
MAESADPAISVAAVIRAELPHATFPPALRRGNVRGALDMGLAPGFLPGRVRIDNPSQALLQKWTDVPKEKVLGLPKCSKRRLLGKLKPWSF